MNEEKPLILLLDTNVIVDIMLNRNQFVEAKAIIESSLRDESIDCVTATTITDISYLVGKNSNPKLSSYDVQNQLKALIKP